MPFFQTGDVRAAILHLTQARQNYSEFGIAQSRTWEPGTACITIAANIAETAVLGRRGCFPDSIIGFTPIHQPSDAYFVKYLLDGHRELLGSVARGTTQDNLSVEKLLAHPFVVPDAECRYAISSFLRSLDESIENNRRRVELLEQMAEAIYREWFVQFRYPGHESFGMIDSPLGPIPTGWEVGTITDLCSRIQAGGTPRRSEASFWRGGEVPWYKTGDLSDSILVSSSEKISERAVDISSARVFEADTIFMAIYGSPTVGRLGLTRERSSANQAALGLVADTSVTATEHLWFVLRDLRAYFNKLAQGAAQQNISKSKVVAAPVVIPPPRLIQRFSQLAGPPWRLAHQLTLNNDIVKQIRDMLLPKLVTGQIDVSDLDLNTAVESVT